MASSSTPRLHSIVRRDTQMASSSSTPPQKYEVFLSFRGEDTRYNIVSYLNDALKRRGIITFFDEDDLEKGQTITPELLKSIEESKFAIIIFSKNYASSTWCLDELVKIMKCRSKETLTVIPIFYKVDPSDIRKLKNSFGQYFTEHEATFEDNMEKVQIWKDNLREAAKISGYDFRNVPEAPLINEVVEKIFSKLPLKASPKGIFGIEHRLKKLRSLLARNLNDVCFLGIWGMGGIGKTTTARAIFNELIDGFEEGCFLQDVSKNGIKDLQKSLLSKVLRSPVNIHNDFEGSDMIRDRLCSKKVLLVLDDIDNESQLETLAGDKEWFGEGSRVIVTTRDKHLLNDDTYELYNIETLPYNEAMQLFCWHAFKMGQPPENFVQLADRIVRYADGLPLALKILGSHLRSRKEDVWISTIDKLNDYLDKDIIKTLKISFDGLDDTQKNIFLDIACFYRGFHKDMVNEILDSFDFYPKVGIPVLIDKCLIHIESESDERIQMHDLIEEMGRDIVRQKANKKPERYSRLWDRKDTVAVLTNGTGTGEVEALILLKDRDVLDGNKIKLSVGAFKKMNMLRLLDLDGSDVVGELNLPNSLRYLSWRSYPRNFLPVNSQLSNLVRLELCSSTLETFPDLSCMPNLEFLDLSFCIKLLEVSKSVAVHKKLTDLVLSGCDKLNKFPSIQMESLESLNLYSCSGLRILPEFHRDMICLRTLNLRFMKIKEFPSSVGRLTSLQEIDMKGCLLGDEVVDCFDTQPSSLKKKRAEDIDDEEFITLMLTLLLTLPLLREVNMVDCNASKIILPSNGCFTSLQELDLSWNDIVYLPKSINRFSSLLVLRLTNSKIKELPELPSSIMQLVLDDCEELTSIPPLVALLDKYEYLRDLSLVGCKQLASDIILGPWDWISLANVLSRRQGLLQVRLPHTDTFNCLYQKISSNGAVTVPRAWYDDEFQGFVVFAISNNPIYEVTVTDGCKIIIPFDDYDECNSSDKLSDAILYIPIDKITSSEDWNGQYDYCPLEVLNDNGELAVEWGIRLLYVDDNAPDDISDLIIFNLDEEAGEQTVNNGFNLEFPSLKIFVSARDEETDSEDSYEESDSEDSYTKSLLNICVTARNHIQ